jgi:hypothetical protein
MWIAQEGFWDLIVSRLAYCVCVCVWVGKVGAGEISSHRVASDLVRFTRKSPLDFSLTDCSLVFLLSGLGSLERGCVDQYLP